MIAREFCASFERSFSPGVGAAPLTRTRTRGGALNWVHQAADGNTLEFGFRLNRKNLTGYPGEFMPDIVWSGMRHGSRDTGEVSFYQYALPAEIEAVASLQKRVVDTFIRELHLEAELENDRSLVRLLVDAAQSPIRPHQHRWLPYWNADDVEAWGGLFGASARGWVSRFLANPETLEAWCRRVLWSKA